MARSTVPPTTDRDRLLAILDAVVRPSDRAARAVLARFVGYYLAELDRLGEVINVREFAGWALDEIESTLAAVPPGTRAHDQVSDVTFMIGMALLAIATSSTGSAR